MSRLEVANLRVSYGPAEALRGISLHVDEGEIICIIGSNGAGKSTLLRTISGLVRAQEGSIRFGGRDLTRLSPRHIVRLGIAHSPEGRKIFAGLTVYENLEVATAAWRSGRQSIQRELDYVFDIFPHLAERRNQLGWSLSGGEQQMLAIGRALMARPTFLLLDEPSLGLAPKITEELFICLKEVNRRGTAIVLVEQNATVALNFAFRGYLFENGNLVLSGDREALVADSRVKEAYLGG